MKEVTVPFYYGQKVLIKDAEIKGTVIAVHIEKTGIQFQCVWFYEGKRYTGYFHEFELEPQGEEKEMTIGYNKGD